MSEAKTNPIFNCFNLLNNYSLKIASRIQTEIYAERLPVKKPVKNWIKIFISVFTFGSILSLSPHVFAVINLNQGSLGIGASGILNEATTWICYRLAPATLTIGLVKGFYDIKQHKPDAARKAFITAAAGTGVMLAPTITGAILGIVQNAGGSTAGINIGGGNGSTTVGQP
ncbi:MAG: hypothetical protein ACYDDB_06830 [bacterium]